MSHLRSSALRVQRYPARPFALLVSLLAALLLGFGAVAQEPDPNTAPEGPWLEDERNTVAVVERVAPAVVSVNVAIEGRITNPFEDVPEDQLPPFFREFMPRFDRPQAPRQGSGSGFVVDDAGRVVTNHHVIARALEERSTELRDGAEITVTFESGATAEVRVLGTNALYDLALLELERPDEIPSDVEPLEIGAYEPSVGQKTIAIGNPFGFASTVTVGIVSGTGRTLPGVGEVNVPLIQTDASINPGNSGGPLLDSAGRVIGVNTAIVPSVGADGQRGSLGIGFAVPATTLHAVLDELREGGYISVDTRPRLGVSIQNVAAYPAELRERLDLPDRGVAVLQVQSGSAAEEAGLRGSRMAVQIGDRTLPLPEDVIIAANGEPVHDADQLQATVFALGAGDTVTLTVLRDGDEVEIPVTLRVVPQE